MKRNHSFYLNLESFDHEKNLRVTENKNQCLECFDNTITNNDNLQTSEIKKTNPVYKKIPGKNKNIIKTDMNTNNKISTPVNTTQLNPKKNKENISNHNCEIFSEKKQPGLYIQNKDKAYRLKEKPSKFPYLYYHDSNLEEKNMPLNKNCETYGKVCRDAVPGIFFNHVMTCKNKKNINNRKKYCEISITQRVKKKLLTIIYYSP